MQQGIWGSCRWVLGRIEGPGEAWSAMQPDGETRPVPRVTSIEREEREMLSHIGVDGRSRSRVRQG